MNPSASPEHGAQIAAFRRQHRTGLLTLLFTDIVGSSRLKQILGDSEGVALIQQHHAAVREILSDFAEAEVIDTAGDSFFIVFVRPSEAVLFALRLQVRLRTLARESAHPVLDRIGIHIGEVIVEEAEGASKRLFGAQVDACARVMSLAVGDQILLSSAAFDNARQALKGNEIEGLEDLAWLNHGFYRVKGLDEPIEICEVGERRRACLKAPADAEKAQRQVSPDSEPVLGWRAALGQRVPNTQWILEKKLGEGGFGEVWLGRHQTMKERRVFKFCFRADRVRFLKREMTLFRLLKERVGDHPNIVRLLDVHFNEPPFYVEMDYVEGSDLKTWSEERGGVARIPLETRLEIVAQAADGLQAAHDAGVIHRDIKPTNILISNPRSSRHEEAHSNSESGVLKTSEPPQVGCYEELRAKLTDFGIGQVVSQEYLSGITRAGFTQTMMSDSSSSHTGTQMYMAPELLAGKPASIRSDIYSLGVVLFQLLVGDVSRPVTTDWANDISDPLLRDDLQHCFAGNPNDRFAGAGQIAKNLRALPNRRAAYYERLRSERATQRRRTTSLVSAGVAVVLLLVATALGYGLRRAKSEALKARQNLYAAEMNLALQALEANNLGYVLDLLDHHRPRPGQPDLRGWEWRYLWTKTRSDEVWRLGLHSNSVRIATFSPTGDFLATGSSDGAVKLWDLATMRQAAILKHDGEVASAKFSSNGKILTTGSYDRTLRRWDVATGGEVDRVPTEGTAIAFSPAGDLVALRGSRNDNGNVALWDSVRRTNLGTLHHDSAVICVAFSPDGKMLAAGYWDKLVCLWDVNSKGQILVLTNDIPITSAVAFSFDGKLMAYSTHDMTVKLCDLATRQVTKTLVGHKEWVARLVFSPDNKMLVSAGADHTVKLWNVESGQEITTLYGHLNEVYALAMTMDGRTLASGTRDGIVTLWSTTPKVRERSFQKFPSELQQGADLLALSISPDATTLLTAYATNTLGLWDTASLQERATLPFELTFGRRLAVSSAGRFIATGETNGTLRLLENSTRKEIANFPSQGAAVDTIAFSTDGTKLACGAANGKIRVWEITGKRQLTEIATHDVFRRCLAFSADGTMLGAGYQDATAEIFDVNSGRRLALLHGHKGPVAGVALLPDGKTAATASYDQAVKLWDIKTQRELKSLPGQPLAYFCLAVSPDGRRLAAGGADNTVKVWDTSTQQEVATLKGSAGREQGILAVAFSPDGNSLVAASMKAVYIWRAKTFEEADALPIAASNASSRR